MAKSYPTSWQNPADGERVQEIVRLSTDFFNRYAWTVGFWFRPTSIQTEDYTTFFQIYIDSNNYWVVGNHITGIPYVNINSDGNSVTTYDSGDTVLTPENWYYLCAFGDESQFGMTINGVLTASGMKDYSLPRGTLPDYLYLGSNANGEYQPNGNYSDFILLPYKTTTEQIYGYFSLYRPFYNLPRMEVSGDLVNASQFAPSIFDGKVRQININEKSMKQYYQVGFELTETPGLLSVLTSAQEQEKRDEEAGQKFYMTVGYIQGSPTQAGVYPNKLTHIFYAFSDIYPGTSDIWFDSTKGQYASHVSELVALKSVNPNLKPILSVGGWGCGGYAGGVGASGFEIAMSTAAHRANFAANCAYLVDNYDLAGIDLDCEYPASADKSNFTALVQAVRTAIGSSKFLSITTPAGSYVTSSFDLAALANIVDFIGVMTYDFDQTGTKHDANLYVSGLSTVTSCQTAINTHLTYVPAAQLLMGIPFYGYIGSYSARSYDVLVNSYINKNGYTRYWDDTAKACYLKYSGSFKVAYDDEVSISNKLTYIKAQNLGGAMIWHIGYNDDGTLLTTIYNGLR
jgi:chitinase